MEVHAHTHTVDPNSHRGRKKWTHYFWEFFMMFLAVFAGFLAENQREHMVEHRREKQFMRSLLSDIREDTVAINKSISEALKSKQYQDSVLFYLYNNPPGDFLSQHFLDTLDWYALKRLSVIFNEVTAMQLKNAGNLRLIRNQDVIRKISLYWMEQENIKINLDRYLIYRNRGREFEEKLFAYSDYDLVEAGLITLPAKGVRVIQANSALWSEYANIISHCRITTKQFLEKLQNQSGLANELILLLQKEYHLK